MKWKQFFTPVQSIDALKGHELFGKTQKEELTILDVRQPEEYKQSHIPGSKLIPLPNLNERLDEISPKKTTLVY